MTSPADAVLQLVRAALDPVTVYDAKVPASTATEPLPARYAVIYPSPGMRYWEDLGHTSDCYRLTWQITSVGSTRPEAEWIAARARDSLVDVCPVVDGLLCSPVEQQSSQPVRWDDQIPGRIVMYATDQYSMEATAASS
jgi:hypothetical protein